MLERSDRDGAPLPRVATPGGDLTLLRDTDREDAWLVVVDSVPQSYVDLADPTHLEFAYVRLLGDLVDLVDLVDGVGRARAEVPLRVVHLGGGGATLARYVAATRPGSDQLVVEVDPALAALVSERLGTDGFRLLVGDARAETERLPRGRADVVVLDAFTGSAVPPHLTTREHVDWVRRALAPGGVYAVNVADSGRLGFARSVTATLAARFAAVAVLAPPAVLRGRRFGNLVLVASDTDLPLAALARRTAGRAAEPARLLGPSAVKQWLRGAPLRTDADAGPSPVPQPGVFTLSGPVVGPGEAPPVG